MKNQAQVICALATWFSGAQRTWSGVVLSRRQGCLAPIAVPSHRQCRDMFRSAVPFGRQQCVLSTVGLVAPTHGELAFVQHDARRMKRPCNEGRQALKPQARGFACVSAKLPRLNDLIRSANVPAQAPDGVFNRNAGNACRHEAAHEFNGGLRQLPPSWLALVPM